LDVVSGFGGPRARLRSLLSGFARGAVGLVISTVWLGIGDPDVFDFGGLVEAAIGVVIMPAFVSNDLRATGQRP
jgi:hypothetical protein